MTRPEFIARRHAVVRNELFQHKEAIHAKLRKLPG